MLKSLLEKIKNLLYGKVISQKLANVLYRISIRLMNYGASDASNNGELLVLKRIKNKHLHSEPVIFDVGANLGQYANLIDSIFHGGAKIYSFEPGRFTFQELEKNTKNIPSIERHNLGLGSKEEEGFLNYDKEGSGLASIYKRRLDHMNGFWDKKEKIYIKTVDNFCRENKISKIDFLKMDVEGHEYEVLKGAEEMLKKNNIEAIQFEFGGANIDSRTYFQDFYYLLKDNYRIYRVLKDGLDEIKGYSELNEIFSNINYFAERK